VAHAWQAVPTTRFEAFVRARLLAEARELLEAQAVLLRKAGAEVAGTYLREGPAVHRFALEDFGEAWDAHREGAGLKISVQPAANAS
jgi:hypothetical protein